MSLKRRSILNLSSNLGACCLVICLVDHHIGNVPIRSTSSILTEIVSAPVIECVIPKMFEYKDILSPDWLWADILIDHRQ